MNLYTRGSEWRKWDLHVHTASSYDAYKGVDSDELLVEAWRFNNLSVVAITDHFLIDANRITKLRSLAPDITIMPGFEMRTDKGGPNIHVIGIFSEDSDLEILRQDFNAILTRQNKKESETDATIFRDFEEIIKFIKSHNGISTIHAGKKTNGIDKEITNALEVAVAIKRDIAESIDVFEIGNIKDVNVYNEHVFKKIAPKSLVLCSDNHDPRKYEIKDSLWIKADPTFQGLAQTLLHHSDRVFVGDLPPKISAVSKNKANYIDKITISRTEHPRIETEYWFDSTIELNSALVAIVGNKGSGKSALSDIIGHLCNSNNMKFASFLIPERFRKSPENRASDYFANIEWCDGKKSMDVSIGLPNSSQTIEEAQYLPQRYIENVCSDITCDFQQELEKVIFSYIDASERTGLSSLKELIGEKTRSIQMRIRDMQNKIDNINREIIRMEDVITSANRADVQQKYSKRCEDLERHRKNKPVPVIKPTEVCDAKLDEEIKNIDDAIEGLKMRNEELNISNAALNRRINANSEIRTDIDIILSNIRRIVETLDKYKSDYKIGSEKLNISYSFPIEELRIDCGKAVAERIFVREELYGSESGELVPLQKKIQLKQIERDAIISGADAEDKRYQKYIMDLKEWELKEIEIVGDECKEGSIKYYERQLAYLDGVAKLEYTEMLNKREGLLRELFDNKRKIVEVFNEVYLPIEREISPLLGNSTEKIEFSISLACKDRDIGSKILSFISQKLVGVFRGKADAAAAMNDIVKKTNFGSAEGVIEFLNDILACVYEDVDRSNQKVKDKQEFYRMLTHLEYVDVEYSLTMGGRNLYMLSPGERGIVLLVFYLALSKEDSPLIIDQPEDNLDNESVYKRLVPCIKGAKNRRQVVIVTHNPNIAIACDAEQIICCVMDKSTNSIRYSSGSIENPTIRRMVVDVLEGTMPAFELRKLKYSNRLYATK